MSTNKDNKNEENKEEKIITKYDRKVERRRLEKEREKKTQKRERITGIVVLAAVLVFVLSFPIRNYLALHRTYIKVNGEKVTQVEYDYYFGLAVSNYSSQFGEYLSYFGIDLSGDLSKQMYSDTLTMKDFFDQSTVDTLKQNKALMAQAKADGFTYDTSRDYEAFVEALNETAAANGQSVRDYVKEMAGDYATLRRISKYIKETFYINEYAEAKAKEFTPSDAEIESYYQENKKSYDSFDFRMTKIDAELPTAPTSLAAETPVYAEDGSYTPSDAEVEKAMADAKEKADAEEKTVAKTGEESKGVSYSSINSYVRDWIADESRKANDTTVIESTNGNCYYVVAFENRYRNEDPTVDARVLVANAGEGEAILNEWKSKEATEESFIALCNEKSLNTAAQDGLYEGLAQNGIDENISAWLFDSSRKLGDTTVIDGSDNYSYVIYYIGKNKPQYWISIRNTIMTDRMDEYVQGIRDAVVVEDPKGNLDYLKVQAAESAAAEQEASEDTEASVLEGAESGETSAGTESAEQKESDK